MPRAGIEPATRGFSVLCSTNWAIWACPSVSTLKVLTKNCGGRIWTCDLRVMSPTSFQTAPSRDKCYLLKRRMGRGGFEPPKQVAADLQSVPFGHSGICPFITKQYKIDLLHSSITWIVKADDRTRTDNLLITNQLLCQLSHIGIYHQLICNQLLCLQLTRFSSIVEKWATSA